VPHHAKDAKQLISGHYRIGRVAEPAALVASGYTAKGANGNEERTPENLGELHESFNDKVQHPSSPCHFDYRICCYRVGSRVPVCGR
jgi:hypothetical protein